MNLAKLNKYIEIGGYTLVVMYFSSRGSNSLAGKVMFYKAVNLKKGHFYFEILIYRGWIVNVVLGRVPK